MYRFPEFLYLYVAILLFTSLAAAQQGKTYHQVFSKKEGLELDKIDALAYDDDGFLWIGGSLLDVRAIVNSEKKNRLQRFNGATFHNIYFPDNEESVLSVGQLQKRADGKMYVHTLVPSGHALFLLDPITTEITRIRFAEDNEIADALSFVIPYQEHHYILHQKGRKITFSRLLDDLTVAPLFSFEGGKNKYLLDPSTLLVPFEDVIFISDDNFPIHFFDWEGTLLKRFPDTDFIRKRESLKAKFFMETHFKKDGVNYVFPSQNEQLHYIDRVNLDVKPVEQANSKLNREHLSCYNDTKGGDITTTANATDVSLSYWSDDGYISKTQVNIFDSATPMTLFSDDVKKELWIGNGANELHYFKFPSETIKNYLSEYSIRALFQRNANKVLVATERNGWYDINLETGVVAPFKMNEENREIIPHSSRNIIEIGPSLWSNSSGNIIEINPATGQTTSFRHFPVICLEKLNDTTLIYGTKGYHLMRFNTRTKQHVPVITTDSLDIFDIAIHGQQLVGATDKGILSYNFNTQETKLYKDKEVLGDSFFLMVDYVDGIGFVLGSRKGIVGVFDSQSGNWEKKYQDPLDIGIGTIIYDNNVWWINTFNGVVAFDTISKSNTRFSVSNGLSHNEANRYSALKIGRTFLVGSLRGLNVFDPSELHPEALVSTLKLQRVKKYNPESRKLEENFNQLALNNKEPIVLLAEHRELELDYALTHATAISDNTFKYRLNRGEWVGLRQDQSVAFPNMAPGNYTLEIVGEDFSGNQLGEPLQLAINAQHFFYRTWWFYTIVLLLTVSLLLYFLYQSKQKQKMQERFASDLLTSQEEERNHIAKELHDSVGQQLTLIKKTTQQHGDTAVALLADNVLEEVRAISRGLYPANLKLLGLTESIEQLVFDLDEQSDTFFSVTTMPIDDYFNANETLNVFRLIQECLTNSLKHAKATAVEVEVEVQKNQILITVSDNGVGFEVADATLQRSLGLKTLAERVKILKGTLAIQSAKQAGTKITVAIPKK